MLTECIKNLRTFARTHNIKDRTTNVIQWAPIMLLIYVNVGLLAIRYSREDNRNDSIND